MEREPRPTGVPWARELETHREIGIASNRKFVIHSLFVDHTPGTEARSHHDTEDAGDHGSGHAREMIPDFLLKRVGLESLFHRIGSVFRDMNGIQTFLFETGIKCNKHTGVPVSVSFNDTGTR